MILQGQIEFLCVYGHNFLPETITRSKFHHLGAVTAMEESKEPLGTGDCVDVGGPGRHVTREEIMQRGPMGKRDARGE